MENMLVKPRNILFIFIFILILNPIAKADSENIKQSFYIITEDHNSKDIEEDLKSLSGLEIPISVIINPEDKIHRNVIDVLEKFQMERKLYIFLKDTNELEKSYFASKKYVNRLKLSGLYNIDENEFNYIGKYKISFDLIEISTDPLEVNSLVDLKKDTDKNFALIFNRDKANISTLLLAYNQLIGLPLELGDYTLKLEEHGFIYRLFIHIGDITIIFFSISIIILLLAIVILKKWSNERFYYEK